MNPSLLVFFKKPNKRHFKYWLYNYSVDEKYVEYREDRENREYKENTECSNKNISNITNTFYKHNKYYMYGYFCIKSDYMNSNYNIDKFNETSYTISNSNNKLNISKKYIDYIISSSYHNKTFEYNNIEYVKNLFNIYDLLLNHIYLYQNIDINNLKHYINLFDNNVLQIGLNYDNIDSNRLSLNVNSNNNNIFKYQIKDLNNQESCKMNYEDYLYPIDSEELYKFNINSNSKECKYKDILNNIEKINYIQLIDKYWCNEYSQQFIFIYICSWVCHIFTNEIIIIDNHLIPIHEQIVFDYTYNYNIPFDFKRLFIINNKYCNIYYLENIIGFFNYIPNHQIFKDFLAEISSILIDNYMNMEEYKYNYNFIKILQSVVNRIEKMYRYFD